MRLLASAVRHYGDKCKYCQEREVFSLRGGSFTDDVLLYLQVLVDEIGTVDTVGHNATHKSGGKEYIFRLLLIEEAAYSNSVEQIEFFVGLADEIGVSFLLKIFQMAEPTSPRWPATYILAFLSNIIV